MQADTRALLITALLLTGCSKPPPNFTDEAVAIIQAACADAQGQAVVHNGIASGRPRSVNCEPRSQHD